MQNIQFIYTSIHLCIYIYTMHTKHVKLHAFFMEYTIVLFVHSLLSKFMRTVQNKQYTNKISKTLLFYHRLSRYSGINVYSLKKIEYTLCQFNIERKTIKNNI